MYVLTYVFRIRQGGMPDWVRRFLPKRKSS